MQKTALMIESILLAAMLVLVLVAALRADIQAVVESMASEAQESTAVATADTGGLSELPLGFRQPGAGTGEGKRTLE
jgi:hypothetical protein